MASLSPAVRPTLVPRQHKRRIYAAFAIGFVIGVAIGFYLVSANWTYRYRNISPALEEDLASQVEVASYHRTYFPIPSFVATRTIGALRQIEECGRADFDRRYRWAK